MNKNKVRLNSKIGAHGSYIWESKVILEEYYDLKSYNEIEQRVIEDNIINKSSEPYRKSIFNEVTNRYIQNKNKYVETPLIQIINSNAPENIKNWVLYYDYCENDLVYILTTEFLYPLYKEKKEIIDKHDVLGFIEELSEEYSEISEWSDNTKGHISRHYLAALKDFNILEGDSEKRFKHFYLPEEIVVYVVYSLIGDEDISSQNLANHDDWKLFMLSSSEVRRKLQEITPKYIVYEKRGSVEQIEPQFESLEECINEFSF